MKRLITFVEDYDTLYTTFSLGHRTCLCVCLSLVVDRMWCTHVVARWVLLYMRMTFPRVISTLQDWGVIYICSRFNVMHLYLRLVCNVCRLLQSIVWVYMCTEILTTTSIFFSMYRIEVVVLSGTLKTYVTLIKDSDRLPISMNTY